MTFMIERLFVKLRSENATQSLNSLASNYYAYRHRPDNSSYFLDVFGKDEITLIKNSTETHNTVKINCGSDVFF